MLYVILFCIIDAGVSMEHNYPVHVSLDELGRNLLL